jgi:hypothetical protein
MRSSVLCRLISAVLLSLVTAACGGDSQTTGQDDAGGRPEVRGDDGSGTGDDDETDASETPDDGSSDPGGEDAAVVDVEDPDITCFNVTANAQPTILPADIIWVVDTSGSMQDEAAVVEAGLNEFVFFIQGETQLDVRVVMIANDPGARYNGFETLDGICVPPPLGGLPNNCPQGPDVNSDRYLHIREIVYSFEPFPKFIEFYDQYKWFLREGVPTHLIMVTDDASAQAWSSTRFAEEVEALEPGFPQGYRVHAIAGPISGACTGAENPGAAFYDMAQQTGGYFHSICDRDWDAMFLELANRIQEDSVIPCQYAIPDPGDFEDIDPNRIQVTYTDGTNQTEIARVLNEGLCDPVAGGYYTNDLENPTQVLLCPASCGQVVGEVSITFVCVKGGE